ncbi:MAG: DUF3093 domain-containing protein [Salinibacterium sp.]|nr:MAG: DUF3093 domain-containing protein [Salinibacterium sp.]
MQNFRERLWPAPWLFLGTALVIPASLLVFLPINQMVGIVVAVVLYAGCVAMLLRASPVIEVSSGELVAGRARLPISVVGALDAFSGEDARLERGQRLDARAWLLIRGWVDPVVRVELNDEQDPTPYWLLSTRRPAELIAALEAAKSATPRTPGI